MKESIKKLLSISTVHAPIEKLSFDAKTEKRVGYFIGDLCEIYMHTNGFYAFESALHFFAAQKTAYSYGIEEWNDSSGWLAGYKELGQDVFCFAEDIFGGQFIFHQNKVSYFDPETGDKAYLADTLDDWAAIILEDYNVRTGYGLAHAWQKENGSIPSVMRLMPKTPFVLGGEYSTQNLYRIESKRSMHLRSNLALQIYNLPDGAQVKFEIID
jgi:hypothetical protein